MAAHGMMAFQRLLEQLRSEEQQVLTPVGPDMSASGFMIDILEIHGLHLLAAAAQVGIVGTYAFVEGLLLFVAEGGGVRIEGVEYDARHYFAVVVVWQAKAGPGEMQAVALFEGRYVQKLDYVAVGYEFEAFAVAFEFVAVLDRHQFVVANEAFLLELHGAAYACILFERQRTTVSSSP